MHTTITQKNDLLRLAIVTDAQLAPGYATAETSPKPRAKLVGFAALPADTFNVDFSRIDERGYVTKEERVDLMNVADPNDLNRDGNPTLTFPFMTVENLLLLDPWTVRVANDNNNPFSAGRGTDIDSDEIIKPQLSKPLRFDPRPWTR